MDFKTQLNQMREFLASKSLMKELAERADVNTGTVYNTFSAEKFEDLKGKQITVYQKAIEIIEEVKSLPEKASAVLNK